MAKQLQWEFPQTILSVTVLPSQVVRALQPVTRPLYLRSCVEGYNERDVCVKTLYCTENTMRFFTHEKDGWHEQKFCFNPGMQNHKGGSAYPKMRQFGNKLCHHLVAHAWLGPRPKGYECDHINGDKLNYSADNLQWVTPQENQRRCNCMRAMRRIGLNPEHLYKRNLLGAYDLTAEQFEYWLSHVQELFAASKSALTIESINLAVAQALDDVHDLTITCSRCGRKMMVDTQETYTRHGILCDCCYGDLYG